MSSSFPEWLVPMAATLTQERFTGPEWLFERKFDGIRLLAFKNGADVQLFSRNHLPQNVPSVSNAIAKLPHDELILDGEITWPGGSVIYHVFDIMWLDGRDLRTLPLEERLEVLKQLPLSRAAASSRTGHRRIAVGARRTRRLGRRDRQAPRLAIRTSPLAKLAEDEVRTARKTSSLAGSRIHKANEWDSARYSLVTSKEMISFLREGSERASIPHCYWICARRLDQLEIPKPPFTKAVGLPRVRQHWVKPEIVVNVGFIEWTVHGKLRHPRLLSVVEPTHDQPSGKDSVSR